MGLFEMQRYVHRYQPFLLNKKAQAMNQYDEQETAFNIDGFYRVSPSDPNRKTPELAFHAAKADFILAMQKRIEMAERFPFDRWFEMKRKGI